MLHLTLSHVRLRVLWYSEFFSNITGVQLLIRAPHTCERPLALPSTGIFVALSTPYNIAANGVGLYTPRTISLGTAPSPSLTRQPPQCRKQRE